MVDLDKLEQLLIANWTKFINVHKFMALVLTSVRDSDLVQVYQNSPVKASGIQITVSAFNILQEGRGVIWADFVIPKSDTKVAVGTCEIALDWSLGTLEPVRTVGNLYCGDS